MTATTNIIINMNNKEDANKAAEIMKETASKRTPETLNEINNFISGITVKDNSVIVDESYSLMSNTFCELIPQIMMNIVRHGFGAITMEAWFTSYSCGYEAEFTGKVFKSGKYRMTFKEHE